jgi:molecular chaperone GrpE
MKKEDNKKDIEEVVEEQNDENKEDINSLLETIKVLTEQNESLNDKVLRVSAELQNYKRRKDEEVDRLIKYSEEKLILEILPIVDNFERAIVLDDENLNDELSKFLQGFKIIYSNLISILNKFEVKEIEALDKEFDPNYHQAVLTDTIEDKDNNIIIEVLQKGYMYKDKVIRPSMVKVNNK